MSYLTPRAEQEGLRQSLKATVRLATTGNVNLGASLTTVDAVALRDRDRVLVWAQTAPVENGIYSWSSTTSMLSRARDALELSDGLLVTVGEGTQYSDTVWKLTTDNPITVGVTGLLFTQQMEGGSLATTLTLGNVTGGTDLLISSGDALSSPTDAGLGITAGDGSAGNDGGRIRVTAGSGGPSGGLGGDLLLRAGTGTGGSEGGEALVAGGAGNGVGSGGVATLQGGTGGASDGAGADAVVRGGAGGATNGDGGDVVLVGGTAAGSGTDGIVQVQNGLHLPASATPSTGGTEAALFVSNGAGGLTANAMYLRPASDGDPVLVSGGFDVMTLGANESVDGVTSQLGVCQFAFNPNEWGLSRNFYFEVVLSVDDVLRTGQAWLYNLTDLETVTGTTLGTSSLTPTKYRSAALTVGSAAGNLKDSEKVYEVRIDNDGTVVTENTFLGISLIVIEG
jgi:hypothetical protein